MGSPLVFWPAAALACASALGVVLLRTTLYAALSLGLTLVSTAILFLNLQAHLAAAVQVLIYAGAILVLILFSIMLLNVHQDSERGGRPAALLAGACAAGLLAWGLSTVLTRDGATPFLPLREGFGTPADVGRTMFASGSSWIYPFELASILLLAAIVGAVALGKDPSAGTDAGEDRP